MAKRDSELLIAVTAPLIVPARPRERLIEIPQGDLWIGSSDGEWQHMVEPTLGCSSEWTTVERAWIGTDEGTWRQWYPDVATASVLMVEGFDNGFGANNSYTKGYWVGQWPTGSYPTPWASDADWGTRKTVPVPASPTDASEICFVGMDHNPYSGALVSIVGESVSGVGYRYWAMRSTDNGDTWTEIAELTGAAPVGGPGPASGIFHYDWGTSSWERNFAGGDTLRYCGGSTWIFVLSDWGQYLLSDDDGLTWHNPGGRGGSDGTALRGTTSMSQWYYWAASIYPWCVNVNYRFHATDGPDRSLCASPPATRTVVFGSDCPMVSYAEQVAANQWQMATEWYSIEAGWSGGIPPYTTSGTEADLIGPGYYYSCNYAFVPGSAQNKWLYTGAPGAANEHVAIVPDEDFRPSTSLKAIGSAAYIVSAAYQANVYTGWAGSLGAAPPARSILASQILALPHPTTSGHWRAWVMQGQTGLGYCETLCYSDDQGTTWTSQADYSLGSGTMAAWLGAGQHPFFYPGHVDTGQAGQSNYVCDIAFHPDDPKTLLSIGRVEGSAGYGWCQAASYDGGTTWDDLVELTDPGSGGPYRAQRLIVLGSATGQEAVEQAREVFARQLVAHAPAVLTGDVVSVASAFAVAHAPAVTAAVGGPQRIVLAAVAVAYAPSVTTSPTFVQLAPSSYILHAPAVDNHARSVGAYQIAHAPTVTTSLNPTIGHWRTVAAAAAVAHAPAVTAESSARAAAAVWAVLHAPAVTVVADQAAAVAAAVAVWHAPAPTTTADQEAAAGGAAALWHAPAVTVSTHQRTVAAAAAVWHAPAVTTTATDAEYLWETAYDASSTDVVVTGLTVGYEVVAYNKLGEVADSQTAAGSSVTLDLSGETSPYGPVVVYEPGGEIVRAVQEKQPLRGSTFDLRTPEQAVPLPLTNPGAEDGDLPGWTKQAGSPDTGVSTLEHWGRLSFYMNAPVTESRYAYQDVTIPAALEGQVDGLQTLLRLTAWGYGENAGDWIRTYAEFYDSGMGLLGTTTDGTGRSNANASGWVPMGVAVPVPENTRTVRVYIEGRRSSTVAEGRIDDVYPVLLVAEKRVRGAFQIAHAPAVTASQTEPKRAAGAAHMIAHAPHVATPSGSDRTVGSVTTVLHAPEARGEIEDMIALAVYTPSAVSELDITGIDGYEAIRIVGYLRPATDGDTLQLRLSNDGGSTFRAGASDYEWALTFGRSGTGGGDLGDANDVWIQVGGAQGNLADEHASFTIDVIGHDQSGGHTSIVSVCTHGKTDASVQTVHSGGKVTTAEANDAIRLLFDTGNITSGRVAVYGLRTPT